MLEKLRSPEDLLAVVNDLREWLRGPQNDTLRRALSDWVVRLTKRFAPEEAEALSGVRTLEGVKMTLEGNYSGKLSTARPARAI